MIERDYILRMSNLLGQGLARILFFREMKEYEKALTETDNCARTVLGLNIDLIERMPVAGLVDLLGSDPALLHSKLYVAGSLLKEKGEILEFQEIEDEGMSLYMKSLSLFMQGMPANEDLEEKGIRAVDFVLDKLKFYELPVELKKQLVVFFESIKRFDKSEDVIFEIVEDDAGFVQYGISFYERLLLKSDDELEKGCLPRNEVEDGLADLQKKLVP